MEKAISLSNKLLLTMVFWVTIFFLPVSVLNFSQSKVLIFQVIVSIVTLITLIALFKKKSFGIYKSVIIISLIILPIIYLASSFISGRPFSGIFGNGFDIDTTSVTLLLVITTLIVSRFFVTKKKITSIFIVFIFSSLLALLFQIFHVVFPSITIFGNFMTSDVGLFGKWNNLGVISIILAIVNILALESLTLSNLFRTLLFILFLPIFFILVISNISFSFGLFSVYTYQIIGIFGLFRICYYLFNLKKQTKEKTSGSFPFASFVAVIFGVVMFLFGPAISLFSSQTTNVSFVEIRPSWESSMYVLPQVLSESPVLGSGPNSFQFLWNKFRPDIFNTNIFWNTDLNISSGFIPTSFFSTGILGIIFWSIIIICSIWYAFKLIRKRTLKEKGVWGFIRKSIGYIYLILLLSVVTYSPDFTIVFFFFVFLGILLSTYSLEGFLQNKNIDLSKYSRIKKYLFNFLIALMFIVLIINVFEIGRRVIGSIYANQSVALYNQGDTVNAREKIKKSINFYESPYFLSVLAQTDFTLLNSDVNTQKLNESDVQILINEAVQSTLRAESLEPRDFRLNIISGDILSGFGRLGAKDGYSGALVKIKEANQKNPNHPLPPFIMGQIYLQLDDLDNAKSSFTEAIRLKPNYIEAYLAVIDIFRRENDLESARKLFDFVLSGNPTDDYLKLERAKFEILNSEYADAVSILDQLINVKPDFLDAVYYRAVAFKEIGNFDKALDDAMFIKKYLPDNNEVNALIGEINKQKDLESSEEEEEDN